MTCVLDYDTTLLLTCHTRNENKTKAIASLHTVNQLQHTKFSRQPTKIQRRCIGLNLCRQMSPLSSCHVVRCS